MKAFDFAALGQTMPMPEVTTPPFAQVLTVFTIGNELAFRDMSHFLLHSYLAAEGTRVRSSDV
jgi:hypothetical protein